MRDYGGMEKGADLGTVLPQNNVQMNVQAGDIILYQGKNFVIYYDTNSWSLTPIGKKDEVNAEELRETLGTGDVTVTVSIEYSMIVFGGNLESVSQTEISSTYV